MPRRAQTSKRPVIHFKSENLAVFFIYLRNSRLPLQYSRMIKVFSRHLSHFSLYFIDKSGCFSSFAAYLFLLYSSTWLPLIEQRLSNHHGSLFLSFHRQFWSNAHRHNSFHTKIIIFTIPYYTNTSQKPFKSVDLKLNMISNQFSTCLNCILKWPSQGKPARAHTHLFLVCRMRRKSELYPPIQFARWAWKIWVLMCVCVCKRGAPVIWGYNFLLCAGKFVFSLWSFVPTSWV